jgi:hypothetical protein
MIFKIATDMKAFVVVLFITLVGFAQGFWVVTYGMGTHSDFGNADSALIKTYDFALGNVDFTEFAGTQIEAFAIALSAFYMLAMAILLLNLLIALMSDSYSAVQARGLAQWRLEQSQLMIELLGAEEREFVEESIPMGNNNNITNNSNSLKLSSSPLPSSKTSGMAVATAMGAAEDNGKEYSAAQAFPSKSEKFPVKLSQKSNGGVAEEDLTSATKQIFVRCMEKSVLTARFDQSAMESASGAGKGMGMGMGGGMNGNKDGGAHGSMTGAESEAVKEAMKKLETKLTAEINALKEVILKHSSMSQKPHNM